MKIGIVCYPTYGGSGVIATELGKALAKKGHKVHFITYKPPTRLDYFSDNIFYHEVTIKSYPLFQYPPYELALASKIVEVVKKVGLDIVHVHYAIPHAAAAYTAKQILLRESIHLPVVTTLHGTDITLIGKDPSYELVLSFSLEHSDGITAVSENLKKETLTHFNKINKEIAVIPNFIDLERFQKRTNENYKKFICPKCEKLIVHTSNFRKVKRIKDVIDVFRGINEKVTSKLFLIGDGPEKSEIKEYASDLINKGKVRFLGKIERVEEVLSISDLFLLTSEKESFGLAALEAMACQVPVVSTNIGGIPEVNKQGVSGYLCNVGDIDDMVQKSVHILADSQLPKFKAGALEIAKQFDIKKLLPIYEKYYRKVIAKTLDSSLQINI